MCKLILDLVSTGGARNDCGQLPRTPHSTPLPLVSLSVQPSVKAMPSASPTLYILAGRRAVKDRWTDESVGL